jgi:hypothetical protein
LADATDGVGQHILVPPSAFGRNLARMNHALQLMN